MQEKTTTMHGTKSSSIAVNRLVTENLNKWDELAPLKEAHAKSILYLNQANKSTAASTTTTTATEPTVAVSAAQATNKLMTQPSSQSQINIQLHKVNEETNALLYNFDIADIEDPRIEKYLSVLNMNSRKAKQLSETIDQALSNLNLLLTNYSQVSEKTKSLHVACEQLLNDQTKLANASYLLNNRLAYFTDIETYAQKLNSPLLENNCEFLIPMLTRIDQCLNYFEANPTHRDSAAYLQTIRAVLRKALHLIRTYTINSLTTTTNTIIQQMQDDTNKSAGAAPATSVRFSADNSYTIFYSKFRHNSHRIKTLMEQLEQRVELNNQPDYSAALSVCHRCYIQQRRVFIQQPIINAMNELVQKNQRDACTLVRSSCSFMTHLCQDEIQLYFNFFGKASVQFEYFQEELCMIIYDQLRPVIIHVAHIETLTELCSILKTEILMDNVNGKKKAAEEYTAVERICSQMLEDVQERLVYRTHIYIVDEILNYSPSKGDLAYPSILKIIENITHDKQQQQQQGNETTTTTTTPTANAADVHGMWYPTLRRTLLCLSKLYRCLDKKIFEGLAQDTLHMCVQSLINASNLIKKDKTPNDGELFLIKYLLILREQIAPFNIEFSVVEVQLDFSKFAEAAYDLLKKKDKFFRLDRNNAFLDFILNGTLDTKENLLDSKREVDNLLKKSCETFIENVCQELFGSVRQLHKQMQTVLQINNNSGNAAAAAPTTTAVVLKQQPFAGANKLHDLFAENFKDIRKKLPLITSQMSLYLSNKDIEQIILKRVKNNIQQIYLDISQIILTNYNEEDQLIIACPTPEQISLWMTVA